MSLDFLATSFVVALVPGTGVVYTVSSSVGGGWRRGWLATIGCTLGVVPHLLAAMLGLSGIMHAGALAFEVVRWLGVAYLVYLGISMMRSGALQFDDREQPREASSLAVVRRGVLLNLLNPKLTLFFVAFLPQFLDAPPGVLEPALVGLGLAFMAVTFAVFLGYAGISAAVRERVLRSPSLSSWIQRTLGALIIGFAARVATTDR